MLVSWSFGGRGSHRPPLGVPSLTRDDPTAFAPPAAFGPFRVLHQIGVGALGPVFRTYEPTRDRLVAVKVFRLDVTPEQAQALADELARAADAGLFHPSIVEPIAAGVEGTVAYRAEEYVAAESLDVAMRHYAPAALDKALPFITQLAGAIDFARAAGVGHGALHPRDVFVTPDEARATGFGVVEALERVGLRAPVRRPYSAPERIRGEAWSTPADVFSLAAITYELLTGRRPSGTGDQIAPLAGDNVGGRATALHDVLARAMHDDPAQRFKTALSFAGALEQASSAEPAGATAPVAAAAAAVPAMATLPAQPEPEEEEAEPEADDIVLERDEDEAHHDLILSERDDEIEPPLFEDEDTEKADPDAALADASFAGLADEFRSEAEAPILRGDTPDFLGLDDEIREKEPEIAEAAHTDDPRPLATIDADVDLPPPITTSTAESPPLFHEEAPDHPRPTMLSTAVGLTVGLLIGLLAGYAVWGRRADPPPPATVAQEPAADPQPPAQGQKPSGREFSEQVVTPPQTAKPPTDAPVVPNEAPGPTPAARGSAPAATTGRIVVQSTPSGASVTVNGQWRGRTPLKLDDLRFGPYTIRIVQPGYTVVREEVRLSTGQPSRTMNVQLKKSGAAAPAAARGGSEASPPPSTATTGSLYVDSRPRGARVFVDGRAAGVTPLRLSDVAAGSHAIRIELAEHRTVAATARVERGREERITVSLERIQ